MKDPQIDEVRAKKNEDGKFRTITIRYQDITGPGDAYAKGSGKILFENEDLRIVGNYSTSKQFDGELLSLLIIRK
jgi:hypothetical protein